MSNERILVTGCAGYVGSMVTQELLHRGFAVLGYDNLQFGGAAVLPAWSHPQFEFVRGDVRDVDLLKESLKGCAGVVHLAAIVGDPACSRDPDLARDINLQGARNVVDLAFSAPLDRLVFASTCSNYGKMADNDAYVDETSALSPVSLYAETKVAIEKEILSAPDDVKTCMTCLRFATVYGVSPRMRFDLTVNQFAMEMVVKKKLQIYGEQFWRPYIHVRDMARAVGLVLLSPEEQVRREVFNVGSTDENYTKKMIADIINQEIPGGSIDYVQKDEDPRDYRVSFDKIRTQLDFVPSRTLRDGVREVAQLVKDGVVTDVENPIYSN